MRIRSAFACTRRSGTSRVALVVAAAACLVVAIPPALAAQAKPVYPSAKQVQDAKAAAGSKAAQVSAIQGQLAAATARLAQLQQDAEVAAEAYNLADALLGERNRAAAAAAARAGKALLKAEAATDKVGLLAAQAYTSGGSLGGLETFLSSRGPQDVVDRAAGLAIVGDIRRRALAEASATSIVAGVLQRQAAQARAQQLAAEQAARVARQAAQTKAEAAASATLRIQQEQAGLVAQLAVLQNTSVQLEQQRQAGLKAEAEARARAAAKAAAEARAAAERRREAAREAAEEREAARQRERERQEQAHQPQTPSTPSTPSNPSNPTTPTPPPAPPAPHGGVAAVIAFARAQIGDWYLWGGSGPDRWDCSGLTQGAWAQAGVYLPHYTGWQYAQTRHVPISERRPGDLVFFGPSVAGIHHVGLYIGDDTVIEAPHTGAQVRYGSIWRSDVIMTVGRP